MAREKRLRTAGASCQPVPPHAGGNSGKLSGGAGVKDNLLRKAAMPAPLL
jgi:hypothetical protein